jgi:hypothetical protein
MNKRQKSFCLALACFGLTILTTSGISATISSEHSKIKNSPEYLEIKRNPLAISVKQDLDFSYNCVNWIYGLGYIVPIGLFLTGCGQTIDSLKKS